MKRLPERSVPALQKMGGATILLVPGKISRNVNDRPSAPPCATDIPSIRDSPVSTACVCGAGPGPPMARGGYSHVCGMDARGASEKRPSVARVATIAGIRRLLMTGSSSSFDLDNGFLVTAHDILC